MLKRIILVSALLTTFAFSEEKSLGAKLMLGYGSTSAEGMNLGISREYEDSGIQFGGFAHFNINEYIGLGAGGFLFNGGDGTIQVSNGSQSNSSNGSDFSLTASTFGPGIILKAPDAGFYLIGFYGIISNLTPELESDPHSFSDGSGFNLVAAKEIELESIKLAFGINYSRIIGEEESSGSQVFSGTLSADHFGGFVGINF